MCLDADKGNTIPQALALYETLRKPRVEQAQNTSRALGELYASDNNSSEFRAAYDTRWSWLWEYDIDKAYEKARQELTAVRELSKS